MHLASSSCRRRVVVVRSSSCGRNKYAGVLERVDATRGHAPLVLESSSGCLLVARGVRPAIRGCDVGHILGVDFRKVRARIV